jgi:hypothetical protein
VESSGDTDISLNPGSAVIKESTRD